MNTKQRFDVDSILEKISPHIPDEEINFLFPFRKFNTQGRRRKFKTSQLYIGDSTYISHQPVLLG